MKRVGLLSNSRKTKATTKESSGNVKRQRRIETENATGLESQTIPRRQLENDNVVISDFDNLSIYTNVAKLSAIEKHLKLLYRPFVCFVKSKCKYKLLELECLLSNTRHRPDKHPALFIRHSNPACSLKVYDNGNICCQGYSYDGAALGAKCFMNTVEQLGYSPIYNHCTFNVVNATFCLPFAINLNSFYVEYQRDCLYNPATHPYLTYKVQESIIKLAIFPMGYVYVLLSSHPRNTQRVIAHILPLLYRHREMAMEMDSMTERELCSGDINFRLLWENEFQKAYQDTLKYYMLHLEEEEAVEERQPKLMLKL